MALLPTELTAAVGGVPVAVGNEVFFVGLFVAHPGATRDLPIARFDAISMMPFEPVVVSRHDAGSERTLGHLVETHSWGGHSGSPAFWVFPTVQVVLPGADLGGPPVPIPRPSSFVALLGLVSAHFEVPQGAGTTGDVLGTIETGINVGVAVVTPAAAAVRELLMREDVAEQRRRNAGRSSRLTWLCWVSSWVCTDTRRDAFSSILTLTPRSSSTRTCSAKGDRVVPS